MHFLNFLTAAESLLNFKLSNHLTAPNPVLNDKAQTSAFKKVTSKDDTPTQNELILQNTQNYDKLMEERQRLINEYLQINIQLLQKKILDKQKSSQNPSSIEAPADCLKEKQSHLDSNKKKIKKVNNCGHEDRGHYAKGMCSNCYHRYGRVKRPWNCPHQKLYAAGMCQNCYINDYNRKKREEVNKINDEIRENSQDMKPFVADSSQVKPEIDNSDINSEAR